jgi:hypothetical protein
LAFELICPYLQIQLLNNKEVEGFTFYDEHGQALKLSTSKLPDPKVLFSPRVGFNLDVTGDRSLQIRGGTGIFLRTSGIRMDFKSGWK